MSRRSRYGNLLYSTRAAVSIKKKRLGRKRGLLSRSAERRSENLILLKLFVLDTGRTTGTNILVEYVPMELNRATQNCQPDTNCEYIFEETTTSKSPTRRVCENSGEN